MADDKPVRAGVQLGLNGAGVDMPEDSATGDLAEARLGVAVGAFVQVALGAHAAFDVGLGFNQRGYQIDFDDFFGDSGPEIRLSYVEVPVAVTGRFRAGGDLHMRGRLGIIGALLVGASIRENDSSDDVATSFKSNDVLVVVGGGVETTIGSQLVFAEISYDIGLRNVAVVNPDRRFANGPIRNRVLTLRFGVGF